MASIFSRIIAGELPCHKVAETDDYFAFLDIRPMTEGHTLCVPKEEVDYLFELDEATYAGLMAFARRVARALDATVDCERVGVMVIGLEVPHAHVHLVPFRKETDMKLGKRVTVTEERMREIATAAAARF